MANQDRAITLFDYYSYGQDRWGSLPFLLARILHKWSGYHWSPQDMHVFRAIWLFAGLLIITRLVSHNRSVVLLTALIAICLPELTRIHIFDLSELYAWQIPGIFLSWYIARRLFAIKFIRTRPRISVNVLSLLWATAFFAVSFLTIWTSVASGPFLCFLVAIEAARDDLTSSHDSSSKWERAKYVLGLALVALGMFGEKLLRTAYHTYCLKRWGSENRTQMALDFGYLHANLAAQIHTYLKSSWWPVTLLPALLLVTLALLFIYRWWRKAIEPSRKPMRILMDDNLILILGMWGMGLMNFVMSVSIVHIRLMAYETRFHTLPWFLGVTGGLLSLIWVFRHLLECSPVRRHYMRWVTVAAFLFLLFQFPTPTVSPNYLTDQKTATTLAEKLPEATLMGGYWDTYLLIALQKTNAMLPLPLQGEPLRMPWTPAMLPDAKQVIVEYRRSNVSSSHSAPPMLIQYGITLRLVEPKWYENEKYAFALYLNDKK
jgi:hypothetical protein